MAEERMLVHVDFDWTRYIQYRYGYTTAYVFMMLSALDLAGREEGGREFTIPCSIWKGLNMESRSWYWALRNLRECGAISTHKLDRHNMVVGVIDEPPCFKKEVDHYDYADK